jgi:hypothetical protein
MWGAVRANAAALASETGTGSANATECARPEGAFGPLVEISGLTAGASYRFGANDGSTRIGVSSGSGTSMDTASGAGSTAAATAAGADCEGSGN